MVIYVETCESGSMFDSLTPDDSNGKPTEVSFYNIRS